MDIVKITKEELSKVEVCALNEQQLQFLLTKTPKKYVKARPAKGGGSWNYVSGAYVRKVLNLMFGWKWSFEIVDEKIHIEAGEVVVKGKLTIETNGETIVKMQYGNKDIMFRKGTQKPLSIGNDLKSAATDALKKCAAELGIAADVYSPDEFREVQIVDKLDEESQRVLDFIDKCETKSDCDVLEQSLDDELREKFAHAIQSKRDTLNV